MKARAAVASITVLTVAIVSAVAITAVRSDDGSQHPAAGIVAVAPAPTPPAGPVVTVPTLPDEAQSQAAVAASAAELARVESAARSSVAAASAAAAGAASASAAEAGSARSSRALAAEQKAAADQAAADKAAAQSAAAARAAASSAAASSSSSAAASASSAAASSSSAAASASSVASQAAASTSLAAVSSSAAADPAPDTSDAVEAAVESAKLFGVDQSVVVMNRQNGSVTTAVDADAEVPSMSLVKLMLAADVIDRAGSITAVDPDTLARMHEMIAASDDVVAQDFYDEGGRSAIITRVAQEYGLASTFPAPNPQYWGDVRITARDMATLLYQLLRSPDMGLWFTQALEAAEDTGADGFDQNFGMNAVPGTGSKQGWGCCLANVLAIHSAGFTAGQIVVVLSTSTPDADSDDLATAKQLTGDPGAQTAIAAVTRTAAAAVG